MQLKVTLIILVLTTGVCLGQNSFPASGPVGIGYSNPVYDLDINGTLPYIRLHSSVYTNNPATLTRKGGIIFNHDNADKTAGISGAVPPGYHVPGILFSTKNAWNDPGSGAQQWYDRMFIHPNGNIGMGTTSPQNALHVKGAIRLDGNGSLPSNALGNNPDSYASKYNFKLVNSNNGFYIAVSGDLNGRQAFIQSGHGDPQYAYGLGTLTLNPFGGNVGIGTGITSPDAKLTVAGDIHSREVRVTVNAGADFVFDNDYQLRPLSEVEDFITRNNHLPEIASAKEMEDNGLELGKMDIKLLQKVEELTLYLIEQNKEIEALKKKIEALEKGKP